MSYTFNIQFLHQYGCVVDETDESNITRILSLAFTKVTPPLEEGDLHAMTKARCEW